MKKKALIMLLAFVIAFSCAIGFTACVTKDDPQVKVTLKANGGAFTDGRTSVTITVDSGSSIQGLVSYPSLEGYVFDGWADDEAGTQPRDLESGSIVSNTVVYAIWAEKVAITFSANGGQFDSGESVFEAELKKGGTTVARTDVSRENYDFGGWYIGKVEGGKVILSESFDFSQPVNEDTVVYAKWVLAAGAQLSAPSNIVVKYNSISWDEVDGANGYKVIIKDSDEEEVYSYTTDNNEINAYFTNYSEGRYTVSVRSNGDGVNYTNSGYRTVNYRYELAPVTISFDISTSELTWEETSDIYPSATSRSLYIFDAEDFTPDVEPLYSKEDITASSYDMSSYDAGAYRVVIVSSAYSFTEVVDSTVVYKVRLATPDVKLASANKDFSSVTLQWKEVKNADGYIVTVGSQSVMTTNNTYTITDGSLGGYYGSSFDFTSEKGMASVRAFNSEHDYLVSLPCDAVISADSLVEISVENDNADAGSVTISGELYQYNEAPFTVMYDYLTNLYAYDYAREYRWYYELYDGARGVSYIDEDDRRPALRMVEIITVTDEKELSFPKYKFSYTTTFNLDYTYVQCGWFEDVECTIPFDFTAPVTRDMTVYAGWVEINAKLDKYDLRHNDFTIDIYSKSGTLETTDNEESVYFVTRVAHKYTLFYYNDTSAWDYRNRIVIYNVTKGTTINAITVSSSREESYVVNAEAGDVIRFTFFHSGTEASKLTWEVRGSAFVPKGGLAGEPNYSSVSASSVEKIYAVKGQSVTLTAQTKSGYTFLGWYDSEGNEVSQEATYTFDASANVTYTAKWE